MFKARASAKDKFVSMFIRRYGGTPRQRQWGWVKDALQHMYRQPEAKEHCEMMMKKYFIFAEEVNKRSGRWGNYLQTLVGV